MLKGDVRLDTKLKWGHSVLDPAGNRIQLPAVAMKKLRQLGVLVKRKGPPQISPDIYKFFEPDCESLLNGLRAILGKDISGPEWLECRCQSCKRDRTLIYHELEQLGLFRLDMATARSAN